MKEAQQYRTELFYSRSYHIMVPFYSVVFEQPVNCIIGGDSIISIIIEIILLLLLDYFLFIAIPSQTTVFVGV